VRGDAGRPGYVARRGANAVGGFDLRVEQNTGNGLRRLQIQPAGISVHRFGTRNGHYVPPSDDNTKKIPLVQRR
jgi:hypothetical protein